jgi:hypothetical protein
MDTVLVQKETKRISTAHGNVRLFNPSRDRFPPQSQYGHDANLTLFFKTERLALQGKKITVAISNVVSPKFLLT